MQHVRHEASKTQEHVSRKTREAREYVQHETRKAWERVRHEPRETRQHVGMGHVRQDNIRARDTQRAKACKTRGT